VGIIKEMMIMKNNEWKKIRKYLRDLGGNGFRPNDKKMFVTCINSSYHWIAWVKELINSGIAPSSAFKIVFGEASVTPNRYVR
jgi:hypothetical protein